MACRCEWQCWRGHWGRDEEIESLDHRGIESLTLSTKKTLTAEFAENFAEPAENFVMIQSPDDSMIQFKNGWQLHTQAQ